MLLKMAQTGALAHYYLAHIYDRRSENDATLENYIAAIEADRYRIGSIEDFTRAIELNPEFALAYYLRGESFYQQNDVEKAIADFEYVIKLASTVPSLQKLAEARLYELQR